MPNEPNPLSIGFMSSSSKFPRTSGFRIRNVTHDGDKLLAFLAGHIPSNIMRVQSIIAPTLHYRAHGIWGERHNNPAFIARSSLLRAWSFGFRHCLGSFASTRPAVGP